MTNERFMVMNHEFTNTGGNCMVSVFTVYDKQLNLTRYVMANEEGGSLQTVDTVNNDIQFDSHEQEATIVVDCWSFDELTTEPSFCQRLFDDDEWELYKYCQFEYYKEYCQHFKTKIYLPVEHLLPALYYELGEAAADWHRFNQQLVSTDGYKVYASEYYNAESWETDRRELQQIKDFQQWHDSILDDEKLRDEVYEDCYVISIAGRSVKIPFDADKFSYIEDLLKQTIKEW